MDCEFSFESLGCLIPGLPNDISLNCLIRLPLHLHPSLRSVSSSWNILLSSHHLFYRHRILTSSQESLLTFRHLHPPPNGNASVECIQYDLATALTSKALASWSEAEAMTMFLRGQACLQMHTSILLLGGYNGFPCKPTSQVLKFCVVRKKIAMASSMLTARANFAWSIMEDKLYVVGGERKSGLWTDKAEAYDYRRDAWNALPDMPKILRIHSFLSHQNKLFVKGCAEEGSHVDEVVLSYDMHSGEWREEEEFLGDGSCGRSDPCKVVLIAEKEEGKEMRSSYSLISASLDSFNAFFPQDFLSTQLRIRKRRGVRDCSKWETIETHNKIRSMSSFSLHASSS